MAQQPDQPDTASRPRGRAADLKALGARVAAAETALDDARGDLKRADQRIKRLEEEIAAVRSALNIKSRETEEETK